MLVFKANKQEKLSKQITSNRDGITYSAVMKLIRKKDVKVNGKRVSADIVIEKGSLVEAYIKDQTVLDVCKKLYKDDNILVIYKYSGFTSESVFDLIIKEYKQAYFIHRLDRNTAGIMLFALNKLAEKELLLGFKKRTFDKYYLAEVIGVPKEKTATMSAYLTKDEEKSEVKIFDKKMANSVPIKTGYTVIEKRQNTSLLEVKLYTGKTHQIRAHLAHIGYPIVGDDKYGDYAFNKQAKVHAQRLWAYKITLNFDEKSPLKYLNGKTFTEKET